MRLFTSNDDFVLFFFLSIQGIWEETTRKKSNFVSKSNNENQEPTHCVVSNYG